MITIESLSVSSTNSSDDCQWKFFLEYILKFESPTNKKAYLGSCAHAILEDAAIYRKSKSRKKFDINKCIVDRFNEFAGKPDLGFVMDHKDLKFITDQVNWVMNSVYNPLKLKVVETEKKFELEIQRPGFDFIKDGEIKYLKIRGVIDLIVEVDKDTCEVIDYKTGSRKDFATGQLKEISDFEKDIQLRLYSYAISLLYPQYKNIIVTIIYTSDGGAYSLTIPKTDAPFLLDHFRRKFNEIQNISKPWRLKDDYGRSDKWKCKYLCSFGKSGTCDKLYDDFKKLAPEVATEKLYNLSVSIKKSKPAQSGPKKEMVTAVIT